MSYQVLARKWRPLRFDDIVGQDHITRTLKKAVQSSRISHAYMFAGPRGCGKTSTARILARVINCENPPGDGNPCNQCASCLAVIQGNNLDVLEIDGASHTGVAEVRDLQESIGYTPSRYRSKVYIIDEVHMLSAHAFNALLKTLEEPPRHVYFVFATTAPQKIPDTIKSRCQRHHFKRLEVREIAGQLRMICDAESVPFEDDALRLLARKADGSMRDGVSLLDQCITSSERNVSTAAVRDILGLIDEERVIAFMDSIAAGDPTVALRLLDACIDEGVDIQELSAALLEGFRDLMILAAPGDLGELVHRSQDGVERFRRLLPRYELADLVTVVERLCDTTPRLKTAADPRVLLESLLVDLSLLDRQVDIRRLLGDIETPGGEGATGTGRGPGSRRAGRPAPDKRTDNDGAASALPNAVPGALSRALSGALPNAPPGTAPDARSTAAPVRTPAQGSARVFPGSFEESMVGAQVPAEPDVDERGEAAALVGVDETLDFDKLSRLWDGFVNFVRQKKVSLGVCLISGKLSGFDGHTLSLRFTRGFALQKEQVGKPANTKFLKQMLNRYFGRSIELECFLEGEVGKAQRERSARTAQPAPAPAEDSLRGVSEDKKAVVRRLMEAFDGEIIRYNR
jgi:DNA polymerase-3 subunit gamma/tau